MSDLELACKLDQLTDENLLSIFRALLLCEVGLNHIHNSLSEVRGELVDSFSNDAGIGDIPESHVRRGVSGKRANISMGRAA